MAQNFEVVTLDEIHYNFLRNTQGVEKSDLESSHPYTPLSTAAHKEIATVPHTITPLETPPETPPETPSLQYKEPPNLQFTPPPPEQYVITESSNPAPKVVPKVAPKVVPKVAEKKYVSNQKTPDDWNGSIPPKIEPDDVPEPSDKDEAHMKLVDLLPRVHKGRFLEHHHFNALSNEEKEEHASKENNPFKHFNEKEQKVLRRDLTKLLGPTLKNVADELGLENIGAGYHYEDVLPQFIDRMIEEMGPMTKQNKKGSWTYHKGLNWNEAKNLIPPKSMVKNWARRFLTDEQGFGEFTGHKEVEGIQHKQVELEEAQKALEKHKQKLGAAANDEPEEGVYSVPDLSTVATMQNMKDVAAGIGGKWNPPVQTPNGGYQFSISNSDGTPMVQSPTIIGLRDQLVSMGKLKQSGGKTPFDKYESMHEELLGHKKNRDELQPRLDEINHNIEHLEPEDIHEKIQEHKANVQQGWSDVFDIARELDHATDLTKLQKDKVIDVLHKLNSAADGIEDENSKSVEYNINLAEKLITSLILPEKYHKVLAELKTKSYNLSHDVKSMQELSDPKLDVRIEDLKAERDAIFEQLDPHKNNIKEIEDKLQKMEEELPDFGKYKELKEDIAKREKEIEELSGKQKGVKLVGSTVEGDDGDELELTDETQKNKWSEDQALDSIFNKQAEDQQPLTQTEIQALVHKGDLSALFGSDENDHGMIHIANQRMLKYHKDGVLTDRLQDILKQFAPTLTPVEKVMKNGSTKQVMERGYPEIPKWLHVEGAGASDMAVRQWDAINNMIEPSQEQIEQEMEKLGEGGTEEKAKQNVERRNANNIVRFALQFSKYHVNPQSPKDVYAKEEQFKALEFLIGKGADKKKQSLKTFKWQYFSPLASLGDVLIDDNPAVDPEDKSLFDDIANLNKHHKGNENNNDGPGTLRRKGHRRVDMMYGKFYGTHPDTIDWKDYWGANKTDAGKTEEDAKQDWYKRAELKQDSDESEKPDFSEDFEDGEKEEPDTNEDNEEDNDDENMEYKSFVYSDDEIKGIKFIFKA